jgi:hypothetical protein
MISSAGEMKETDGTALMATGAYEAPAVVCIEPAVRSDRHTGSLTLYLNHARLESPLDCKSSGRFDPV